MAPARRHACAGAAAVLAAALALALSGCSFAPTPAPTIAWSTATPSAASVTPTPSATIDAPVLDVGTVVATGRLTGDDRISGDVDVRVTGKGTFELRLIDFSSTREEDLELLVSPNVVAPGETCTTSIMNRSYGTLPAEAEQAFELPRGDPSFLDTVLIAHHDPVAIENGCYVSVAASAILEWSLPDMRPGLTVADWGATGGASGTVSLENGVPVRYTVAHNDLAEEVAARLGITVIELFYLNPARPTMVPYPLLEVGEVLNLSKAHR